MTIHPLILITAIILNLFLFAFALQIENNLYAAIAVVSAFLCANGLKFNNTE